MIDKGHDTPITIACLQMPVIWGDEPANIERAISAIDGLAGKDVHYICLPELFTTGFDYVYMKKRDPRITKDILDQLKKRAKALNAYILAGTLPETEEGRVYNTLFVIGPTGKQITLYRKVHLFPLMNEEEFFSYGDVPLVADTTFARIGGAVCYDLRFPGLFRKMAFDGAQIVFLPAQFPRVRSEHWDILLKARAIENQFFMVGINRIGEDPKNSYAGHTSIYDPMGRLVAGGDEHEGWVIGTIDLTDVDRVRQNLPSFLYERKHVKRL